MKKAFLALLFLSLFILSCNSDDNAPEPQPEPNVELQSEENDFVWKAMNYWYFWQEDVPALADTQDDDINEYYSYLNGFSNSEDLFNSLKFSADDFSWFVPDVDEQLNNSRGVTASYGIDMPRTVFYYTNANNNIVIYINYVVEGSPADNAGIQRGDLIYSVNGQVLNDSNFEVLNDIIFAEQGESITIGVGSFVNGSIEPKGDDKTLTAVQVAENPVYHNSIIEEGGKKIGYLVYNRFNYTYHTELNDVFDSFKANGINELILDLRYNPGGQIITSAFLASMIEGNQANGATFARTRYNSKRDADNGLIYPFFNTLFVYDKQGNYITGGDQPINRLTNLNQLYIITSDGTASASEMIINGLNPSMNVILVGLKTVGKNEGSFTVVDAPADSDNRAFTNILNRNPNHNIGLQPIVLQVFNSLGQSDYSLGFDPNIEIDETDYALDILPMGDTNEPLLRAALDDMIGGSAKPKVTKSSSIKLKEKALMKHRFEDDMYMLPSDMKLLKQ